MFKKYKTDNGYHEFSITKIITFTDSNNLAYYNDLYTRLQQDDFGDIKVPRFTFEMTDKQLIVNSEFIKGRQWQDDDFWHNFDIIADNLVMKEGECSFKDYNPHNFIVESNTEDLYYIDFEGYDYCTIDERSHILQQERDGVLARLDPVLKSHRIRSRFKIL